MLTCLLEIGMTEQEVIKLMRMNQLLIDTFDFEARPYVEFLHILGCTDQQIMSIVKANPFLFDYKIEQIIALCAYMIHHIKIKDVPAVLVFHPYLLNKDVSRLKGFVKEKTENGMTIKEICDSIVERPFVIDCAGY